jgi:hypothetical protein
VRGGRRRGARGRALVVAGAIVALAASACGGSDAAGPTRTPAGAELRTPRVAVTTATPQALTIVPIAPGTPPIPGAPPATMSAHGEAVGLVAGSFFWENVQADAFRVVTPAESFAVASGELLAVDAVTPGRTVVEGGVATVLATAAPVPLDDGSGRVEWPFGPTYLAAGSQIAATGLRFNAPQAPGRYVASIFLKYDNGWQVYYAGLIEVR